MLRWLQYFKNLNEDLFSKTIWSWSLSRSQFFQHFKDTVLWTFYWFLGHPSNKLDNLNFILEWSALIVYFFKYYSYLFIIHIIIITSYNVHSLIILRTKQQQNYWKTNKPLNYLFIIIIITKCYCTIYLPRAPFLLVTNNDGNMIDCDIEIVKLIVKLFAFKKDFGKRDYWCRFSVLTIKLYKSIIKMCLWNEIIYKSIPLMPHRLFKS